MKASFLTSALFHIEACLTQNQEKGAMAFQQNNLEVIWKAANNTKEILAVRQTLLECEEAFGKLDLDLDIPVAQTIIVPSIIIEAPAAIQEDLEAQRQAAEQLEAADARKLAQEAEKQQQQDAETARRKGLADAKEVEKLTEFQTNVQNTLARIDRDNTFFTLLKSFICYGRSLQLEKFNQDTIYQSVAEELTIMGATMKAMGEDRTFWALNPTNDLPAQTWEELSEGYRYLANAETACDWMERNANLLTEDQNQRLISSMAAAQAYLTQLLYHRAKQVKDPQPVTLQKRLVDLNPKQKIPWWTDHSNINKLNVLRRGAATLAGDFDTLILNYEKNLLKEDALEMLGGFIFIPNHDNFDEHLVQLAVDCVDAGVTPTHRVFLNILGPFRNILKKAAHPKLLAVTRNLDRAAMLAVTNKQENVNFNSIEEWEPKIDPMTLKMREELREFLKGKTVMFLGGSIVHEKHKVSIQQTIGCEKLIWPEVYEDMKPSQFMPEAQKSDVVCQLIRWSRHNAKSVLDHAKKHGRLTAVIKSGLGANRVVFDLYEQLIGSVAAETEELAMSA